MVWFRIIIPVYVFVCTLWNGLADPVHSNPFIVGWNSPLLVDSSIPPSSTVVQKERGNDNDIASSCRTLEKKVTIGWKHSIRKSTHSSPVFWKDQSILISADYQGLHLLEKEENSNHEWSFPLHFSNIYLKTPIVRNENNILLPTYKGEILQIRLLDDFKLTTVPFLQISKDWITKYKGKETDALQSSFIEQLQDVPSSAMMLSANPLYQSIHDYQSINLPTEENDPFQYQHDDPTTITEYYQDLYEPLIKIPPHLLSDPIYFEEPKHYDLKSYDLFSSKDAYLAMSVSYYFDPETDVAIPRNSENYVASSLVLFHIPTSTFTHTVHLELSTDYSSSSENKNHNNHNGMIAMATTSPTVVDINQDGYMDILVGTSMGRIYAYSIPHIKQPLKLLWELQVMEFPIHHSIQAKVISDYLQLFVLDKAMNIACLNVEDTSIKWKIRPTTAKVVIQTSGLTLADVNQNGILDILITVTTLEDGKYVTKIYAIQATDGTLLHNYPMLLTTSTKTTNDVMNIPDPTFINIMNSKKDLGVTIVQPFGNQIYFVHNACLQSSITIGESTISVPIQVVPSRDELLVTTVSGTLLTLQLPPFRPYLNRGILSKSHHYNGKQTLDVSFEIIGGGVHEKYFVEIRHKSRVYFRKIYNATGIHSEQLYLPFLGENKESTSTTLTYILKSSPHGFMSQDSFSIYHSNEQQEENLQQHIFNYFILFPIILAVMFIFTYRHNPHNRRILDY